MEHPSMNSNDKPTTELQKAIEVAEKDYDHSVMDHLQICILPRDVTEELLSAAKQLQQVEKENNALQMCVLERDSLIIERDSLKSALRERDRVATDTIEFLNALRQTHDLDIEPEIWSKVIEQLGNPTTQSVLKDQAVL
jgi:hypothetical protein